MKILTTMQGRVPVVRLTLALLLLLLFVACEQGQASCLMQLWSSDGDADGLPDAFENCLAEQHAPVLYLPLDIDWIHPTSVDQYLPEVELRFNHDNGCGDTGILNRPTFQELISQSHEVKRDNIVFPPWNACTHTSPRIYSNLLEINNWRDQHHFFLEQINHNIRSGSLNAEDDWKVYTHSFPTNLGVDIEYWYFFPYNDNWGPINHEADWEHITVRLNRSLDVYEVVYYTHGDSTTKSRDNVNWYNIIGEHPLVWIADGSHASYWSNDDACNDNVLEGYDISCQTQDIYRWFTWAGGKGYAFGYQGFGLVQIGERDFPLNGQIWIQYSGRWGEVGEFETTSGPTTPSAKDSWGIDQIDTNPHDFLADATGILMVPLNLMLVLH